MSDNLSAATSLALLKLLKRTERNFETMLDFIEEAYEGEQWKCDATQEELRKNLRILKEIVE